MSKSLREQLNQIYEDRHQLTAEDVVDVATDPAHPLHSRFEWDDKIAGPKYRLAQAKGLIRSCKITYRDDTAPASKVRAFQHVTRTDGAPTYMPSEDVVQDPIATQVILRSMRRDWAAMRNRYKNFEEFGAMVDADRAADLASRTQEPEGETG